VQADGLGDVAVATALAVLLSAAASTELVIAGLKTRFILGQQVLAALALTLPLVTQNPPPVTGVIGAASAQTSRQNLARRVQYVIAATRRVMTATREARAQNQPVAGAVQAQLAREQRYYSQHLAAMWQRSAAAGQVDMQAAEHGPLLGWYSRRDKVTSAECKAADGWNFLATAAPDIGFPGAVHLSCRCLPGPAHPGARLLPSRATRYARAA
jgi:hypothetical protein